MSSFRVDLSPSQEDILSVIDDMRSEDVEELEAWGFVPDDMRMVVTASNVSDSNVAYLDDRPVFAWGLSKQRDGVFALWGVGTSDTRRIIRPLTRFGKTEWLPSIFASGLVRRIDVHVPLKSSHSWSWLMWLGCKIETRLRYFGAQGEEFLLLAYTEDEAKQEYPNVYVSNSESLFSREAAAADGPGNVGSASSSSSSSSSSTSSSTSSISSGTVYPNGIRLDI